MTLADLNCIQNDKHEENLLERHDVVFAIVSVSADGHAVGLGLDSKLSWNLKQRKSI